MLLLERLLVLENETLLRKQEKPPPERESVQLDLEKVLEEPQEDLQEDEDARIFSSFFITFDTNCKLNSQSVVIL